jgi:Tol biopolymer transport system component
MNPETGTVWQITNNGMIDETPSFSPDSWRIVYASFRSQSGWDLYAYDLRRGTEQQLTAFEGQARFPAWSPLPGDTRIVFEGRVVEPERAVNIWLLDAATGEMEQLTEWRGRCSSRLVAGRQTDCVRTADQRYNRRWTDHRQ